MKDLSGDRTDRESIPDLTSRQRNIRASRLPKVFLAKHGSDNETFTTSESKVRFRIYATRKTLQRQHIPKPRKGKHHGIIHI